MEAKAKRAKRWTEIEVDELLDFVKKNRSKLFGTACHSSANVENVKADGWKQCAEIINAVGFAKREWQTVMAGNGKKEVARSFLRSSEIQPNQN